MSFFRGGSNKDAKEHLLKENEKVQEVTPQEQVAELDANFKSTISSYGYSSYVEGRQNNPVIENSIADHISSIDKAIEFHAGRDTAEVFAHTAKAFKFDDRFLDGCKSFKKAYQKFNDNLDSLYSQSVQNPALGKLLLSFCNKNAKTIAVFKQWDEKIDKIYGKDYFAPPPPAKKSSL